MPLAFTCPGCRKAGKAPDAYLGKKVRCPNCQTPFMLGGLGAPPPVTAPRPAHVPPPPNDNATVMGQMLPPAAPPMAAPRPPSARPAGGDNATVMGQFLPPPAPPPPAPSRPPPRQRAAPPPSSTPPPLRGKRKSGALVWIGTVLALLAIAGLAGGIFYLKTGRLPLATGNQDLAIIEVGSKGVRGLVVEFFRTEQGLDWDWKVKNKMDKQVGLGKLDSTGKSFRTEAISDLKKTLTEFSEDMKSKHGVPADKIYIVFSSGVFASFKGDAPAIAREKTTLTAAAKDITSHAPDFIDATDEAKYTIQALVSPKEREEVLLIDIGSGNTKGGFFADEQFYPWSVNYGVVSLFTEATKQAKETKQPFETVLVNLREEKVAKSLREAIENKPGLARRRKVALTGGIIWALTTYTRPGEFQVDRVELAPGHISLFTTMLAKEPKVVVEDVVSAVSGGERKEAVRKEVGKVQDVFRPNRLLAGSEIVKALSAELKFAEKEVFFLRKGQFAWPMGYLMKKADIK